MTLKQYIDFVIQKEDEATDQELLNCMWIQKCLERKTMPNIKITAEVDGKQVPLETVSTETFEAIKALEKPKEIPVARLATYNGHPRLILKITQNIIDNIKFDNILAIDPISGGVTASWKREWDDSYSGVKNYKDIKPL